MGDSAARALGIRTIAPDRPGYGLSDFKRGRAFVDWSADVIELSEALNLGKFVVLGSQVAAPTRQSAHTSSPIG